MSQIKISRRNLLKWMLAGSAAAVGGYVLSEYAPWLDYEGQAAATWTFMEDATNSTEQMRALVHYATLAPNGHNTQPWKFAIRENAIEIHPDLSRGLEVVDSSHRELWISLGCALENLLIAARTAGYAPEVSYPHSQDFIRVGLTPDTPQRDALFDAIPQRQNTRSEYSGELIPEDDLRKLQEITLEPGVSLRFVLTLAERDIVLEYVNQGNVRQYADRAFLDELIHWLRFNKRDALASLDGLYAPCSGNPEVPRLVGEMFLSGINPQEQADSDAKKLRSSSAVVVIVTDTESKTDWVRAGQVYERLALQMTSMQIQSAFLNQPLEVQELRTQFQHALQLGSALPQLLVRLGYAQAMPRSLRRPVDQVLF